MTPPEESRLPPVPANRPLLEGYDATHVDEAAGIDGVIDPLYPEVLAILDALGAPELVIRSAAEEDRRTTAGVLFTAQIDGESVEQPFPLDLVPRLIDAGTWAELSAGAEQRARALNLFLADVYADGIAEPAGRVPAIVAAGLIPERLVRDAPGYRAGAVGLAPGGRPRATVHGLDLLSDGAGKFVVLEDNLQVPSGLGYALANRRSLLAAVPELAGRMAAIREPDEAVRLLGAALRSCAPPAVDPATVQVAVLSDGPANSAWFEHRTLAEEMGVPVVAPADLVPVGDRVGARLPGGDLIVIDVVYRRLGNDDLLDGSAAGDLLVGAARAGTVTICNAPGNGVADDKAIYAFVGPMIRFYLGEEPLLADVGTWVLGDPSQYAAVRGRMEELVVKPVDGSGGEGVMIGPELTADQVSQVEAAVAANPEGFIAQDVIRFSTHPTLDPEHVAGPSLQPRRVDLRMFVVSGADGPVTVPAALSRVARGADGLLVNSSQGGGSKDTWILG